jgi:hypothetical protein
LIPTLFSIQQPARANNKQTGAVWYGTKKATSCFGGRRREVTRAKTPRGIAIRTREEKTGGGRRRRKEGYLKCSSVSHSFVLSRDLAERLGSEARLLCGFRFGHGDDDRA